MLPARPRRVAIIIDGNRRWARAHGLSLRAGYEAGADTLRERIRDARALGIQQLTIYSLSTENLSRAPGEIKDLTGVLASRIATESTRLLSEGISLRFIGDHQHLPKQLIQQMCRVERLTDPNPAMTIFLAINYGARAEILNAAKHYHGGGERAFQRLLYEPTLEEPELVIRTGGEQRLSNFLLWQAANAELCFRAEMWPDFSRQALQEALATSPRPAKHPSQRHAAHRSR